jgi:hypothetical protein
MATEVSAYDLLKCRYKFDSQELIERVNAYVDGKESAESLSLEIRLAREALEEARKNRDACKATHPTSSCHDKPNMPCYAFDAMVRDTLEHGLYAVYGDDAETGCAGYVKRVKQSGKVTCVKLSTDLARFFEMLEYFNVEREVVHARKVLKDATEHATVAEEMFKKCKYENIEFKPLETGAE